ncbi:MAG: hypothetical protein RSA59_04245, partial [Raoultibacter sp.]
PTDPVDPPKPPTLSVPDNGGTTGNNTNTTPVVERNVPQTLPAAQTVSPATPATDVAQTEVTPTKADTTTAPKGPLENPALGAQSADAQHSHIPLILLLLAVWLVGGIAVIRQRKRTHDAVDNATRTMF